MEMREKLIFGSGFSLEPGRITDRLSVFPSEFWTVGDGVPVSDSSGRELPELAGEGTPAGLQALITRIRNMAVRTCSIEKKR